MTRNRWRLIAFVVAAVLVLGCESDEDKGARLRQNERTSALELWYRQHLVDSARKARHHDRAAEAVLDSLRRMKEAEHDAASRELARFLSGR